MNTLRFLCLLIILLIGILVLSKPSFAEAGDFDTTFGKNGILTFPPYTDGFFEQQSNGKIIVFANNNLLESSLFRLNTDGSLDHTFGNNGYVNTRFPNNRFFYVSNLAIQPDQKIVLAGLTHRQSMVGTRVSVSRFNENGSVDTTFGDNGYVILNFHNREMSDNAASVAIGHDGKIILAGMYSDGASSIYCLNSDGSLNTSFGEAGRFHTSVREFAYRRQPNKDLLIQKDGKILFGGINAQNIASFRMYRLTAGGSLDTTFGVNGVMTISAPPHSLSARSIILQPNQQIVVVANLLLRRLVRYRISSSLDYEITAYRFNSDGKPDLTFGNLGQTLFYSRKFSNDLRGARLDGGGHIVIFGSEKFEPPAVGFVKPSLIKLDSTGQFNPNWGDFGMFSPNLNINSTGHKEVIHAAIQPDNKLLIGAKGNGSMFSIARLLP